jgi:hypothetical protein
MSCVNNDLFLERAEEGGARSHWRHSNRDGCCLERSNIIFSHRLSSPTLFLLVAFWTNCYDIMLVILMTG